MYEFYAKPVASPYLILQRSAVSAGVKRSTLFQEGMRRLRNCCPELGWDQIRTHMNKFSWQMLISGYDQSTRFNILKGVLNRYEQMLSDDSKGIKPLWRTRGHIASQKASKPGRSSASFFLKGDTRQVMMLPPTPGGELVKRVRSKIGNFKGPDHGTTKFGEKAGAAVTAGLVKDNPFPAEGCDFGDSKCIVGAGCSKTGVTYQIECNQCTERDQGARGSPRRPVRGQVIAGSRRKYLGQTGTSMHRRQVAHKSGKSSVLKKHTREALSEDQDPPKYTMKAVRGSRTVLGRVVTEGVLIDTQDKHEPDTLMNSRSEGGRGKMVRYVPQVRRI